MRELFGPPAWHARGSQAFLVLQCTWHVEASQSASQIHRLLQGLSDTARLGMQLPALLTTWYVPVAYFMNRVWLETAANHMGACTHWGVSRSRAEIWVAK